MVHFRILGITALLLLQSSCALLGQSEKAFVDGVLSKQEHRYVVAKEHFDQVDPENRAYQLAQSESEKIEGIVNELRRAQRDGDIAYNQSRWVAALVNYQIVAKYQPWNVTAQERLTKLREKTKIPEVRPRKKRSTRKKVVVAKRKKTTGKSKSSGSSKKSASVAKAKVVEAAAEDVVPVEDSVPEERKVEIDEKLRVSRQLETLGQYKQLVSLLQDVIDFDYRREELIKKYVPALVELAQIHYSETEYRDAANLLEEAYRVEPENFQVEKLLTRTKKLAAALEGER